MVAEWHDPYDPADIGRLVSGANRRLDGLGQFLVRAIDRESVGGDHTRQHGNQASRVDVRLRFGLRLHGQDRDDPGEAWRAGQFRFLR